MKPETTCDHLWITKGIGETHCQKCGALSETKTTILSDDAGLYVMESLRQCIDRIEAAIKCGDIMIADAKNYSSEAREYFKQRNVIEKRCCEEIKALIKEVRYERI